jgi:hypothetical protein
MHRDGMTTAEESMSPLTATIVRRGDPGWDEARQSFSGTIDRHPCLRRYDPDNVFRFNLNIAPAAE